MRSFYLLQLILLTLNSAAQNDSTVNALQAVIVNAQNDSTAKALEEVIVTAQRTAQTQFLVPYSVAVLNYSHLKNINPRTAPEALQGANGVFVQKTNHGGGSAFIRGLTGNQTLILVDGIRLNNSTFRYGPNQYLNTIDVYTIDRIEIAKGTGSVQYGSDALGGAVHIITKEPVLSNNSYWMGKLTGKYMTGDMEKTMRGELNYSSKQVGFTGGVTTRRFGDLIGGDTTGKQIPSGYDEWAVNTKTKILLKHNVQLTIANQFLQQKNVPLYHKIILENFSINRFDLQQQFLNYARLNIRSSHAWIKETEVTAIWKKTAEGRSSQKNGSNNLQREHDETNTIGLTANAQSEFSKYWKANSGAELYHDKINSSRVDINTENGGKNFKRGLYPDNSKSGNYSVYTLHQISFNKCIADAGLRYTTFSTTITDSASGKLNFHPSALVGNAAFMYNISSIHHVYFSYSKGFRAPNIDDMGTLGVVDFRYEIPTEKLSAEKSHNTELGYKFKTSKIAGGFTAYFMQLQNLITRVKVVGEIFNGYQVYQKENNENAVIKGLEGDLKWQMTKWLNIEGSIAHVYGKNVTKNEPLRRIPPLNGRVMSSYKNKAWFAGIEFLFASAQRRLAQGDKEDNRIPAGGTPGWQTLNGYAGYSLKAFALNIGIQNFFNKDYRTHGSGINAAGRSGWVSVTINF